MNASITIEDLDIHANNRALLGGHAAVRAISKCGNHEAVFLCPGSGTGEHCFRVAEELARAAGFVPMPAN